MDLKKILKGAVKGAPLGAICYIIGGMAESFGFPGATDLALALLGFAAGVVSEWE